MTSGNAIKARRARRIIFALGVLLAAGGVIGIVDCYLTNGRDSFLLNVSQTALVVGVVMIGQSVLAKYPVTIDEAFQFGLDIGEESGARNERHRRRPVVVDLYTDGEVEIRRHPE